MFSWNMLGGSCSAGFASCRCFRIAGDRAVRSGTERERPGTSAVQPLGAVAFP